LSDSNSGSLEKPFWLDPPWIVLFDLIRLSRLKPWDVNLAYILKSFMVEMKKRGEIDFTASGLALLSSATIYRMKSELILKLQEPPPTPKREDIVDFIPPPIQIPFRYEYTTTTLDDLLHSLEEALKVDRGDNPTDYGVAEMPSPPMLEELDIFLTEIDKNLEELHDNIKVLLEEKKDVTFSSLVYGLNRLETVRIFLMLLFLVSDRRINLAQEEEFGEIIITLPPGGSENLGTERREE